MKKNMIKQLSIGTIILSLCACSSTTEFQVKKIKGNSLDSKQKISLSEANIYLVNGGDGMKMTYTSLGDKDEIALDSGLAALKIASETLKNNTQKIVTENRIILEDKAMKVGAINESDYLIYSRVEQWSDPLGMNCNDAYYDEASVIVSLYSVKNQELISTSRLSAKSCPTKLNGIPLSTGSPEDLYKDLFSNWLNANFI